MSSNFRPGKIRRCVGMSLREDWDATTTGLKLTKNNLSKIKIVRGIEHDPDPEAVYKRMGYRV